MDEDGGVVGARVGNDVGSDIVGKGVGAGGVGGSVGSVGSVVDEGGGVIDVGVCEGIRVTGIVDGGGVVVGAMVGPFTGGCAVCSDDGTNVGEVVGAGVSVSVGLGVVGAGVEHLPFQSKHRLQIRIYDHRMRGHVLDIYLGGRVGHFYPRSFRFYHIKGSF